MRSSLRAFITLGFCLLAQVCFAGAAAELAFTQRVKLKLEAAIPTHRFEAAGALTLHDSTANQFISLDHLYGFAAANPAQAEAAVESYVARVAEVITELEKPMPKEAVRLAVRNSLSVERSLAAMGSGPRAAMPRNLAGDLVIVPVFDTPTTVKYVGEKDLAALGLTEAQVVALGEQNLRRIQKPLAEVAKIPPQSGIGIINEEYAASRLTFLTDWLEIQRKVGGDLVVMAPAYDTVIYVDGSTLTAVDALRTLGMEIAQRSQVPLSPTLLRFKDDRWEVVK